jgi:HSP20 family protein
MHSSLIHIHPWGALAGLSGLQQQMNRLAGGVLAMEPALHFPLVNLSSDSNEAVLTAEIPGVDPSDLEISLSKGRLIIRGAVKERMPAGDGVTCHLRECPRGSFSRALMLPFEVEEDKISARYDKGVLAVTLPRAERNRPRTIPVTAG